MKIKIQTGKIFDALLTRHYRYFLLFLCSCSLILVFCANYIGLFEPVETKFIDFKFRSRLRLENSLPGIFFNKTHKSDSDRIILIQITDDCLSQFGKWPWKREYFSEVLDFLSEAGAAAVGFDITFSESDRQNPDSDQRFADSISRNGRVVMASELIETISLGFQDGIFQIPSVTTPSIGHKTLTEAPPLKQFHEAAAGIGFVNIEAEISDGVVRRVPAFKRVNGRIHSSLAAKIYEIYTEKQDPVVERDEQITFSNYKLPYWKKHQKLNFLDHLFRHEFEDSFFDTTLYLNYLNFSVSAPFHIESIANILNKKTDPAIFRDRIVIIGFNAGGGILDRKITPLSHMPGMEVQATALENMLRRSFLSRNNNLLTFLALVFITVLALFLESRRTITNLLLHIAVISLLFSISALLFFRYHFIFDIIPVLVQQLSTLVLAKLIALSRSVKLKMNHLEHLNYLSRKLFTILDPENLVKTIFSIFSQQTGAGRGVILVVDQITEQVEYFSFGQTNDDFMVSVANKKVRDAIFSYWKNTPRITRIKELEANSVALDLNHDKNSDILLLPLYLKDAPYGIVFLESGSFREFLRETDSDFWHTFCQIIVAAFENARLYKLATVDGLTGLFVRSFFDVQIQKEFLRAVRYNDQVAYMMSDIDHFKIFNDTYGHQMGDRVLRMVSDEIKRSIRNVDIAARYGGEELCVILPNTGRDGAMLIAERVRSNIEALSIPHEGKEIKITVSIGVSSIPENQPPDVDSFIKEADHALYMAKEGGRNQVRFFTKRKVGDT